MLPPRFLNSACVLALLCPAAADAQSPPPADAPAAKPVTLRVRMKEGLQFDPPQLTAPAGADLIIQVSNEDSTDQTHNLVVVKPGALKTVVDASLQLGEKGPERRFVPDLPEVLASTGLLLPDKKETIRLKLPPEAGVYPIVCTFPGHGLVMYGALYAGKKAPPEDQDENLPPMFRTLSQTGAGKRPFVQRMFMPDAGPAAIAVALPGTQNFCWDAGECRLRYIWSGGFIDAKKYWGSKGSDLAQLKGERWWSAPAGQSPWRVGTVGAVPPVRKFLGYRLENGLPEFRFRLDDAVEVREKLEPSGTGLSLRLTVTGQRQPVLYLLPQVAGGTWTGSAGSIADQKFVTFAPGDTAPVVITLTPTAP